MNKIERTLQQAAEQCSTNGARLTTKREQVLACLLESNKALSAYQLIDLCNMQTGTNMPAMSMYRILKFLEEQELVHKLHISSQYIACSHILCGHSHSLPQFLICSDCQSVEEIAIQSSTIKTLKKNVEKAGYHLMSEQLEMYCLCKGCYKASVES